MRVILSTGVPCVECAARQETSRSEEGEMGGSGAREPPDPSRGGVFIWGKPPVLTGGSSLPCDLLPSLKGHPPDARG